MFYVVCQHLMFKSILENILTNKIDLESKCPSRYLKSTYVLSIWNRRYYYSDKPEMATIWICWLKIAHILLQIPICGQIAYRTVVVMFSKKIVNLTMALWIHPCGHSLYLIHNLDRSKMLGRCIKSLQVTLLGFRCRFFHLQDTCIGRYLYLKENT